MNDTTSNGARAIRREATRGAGGGFMGRPLAILRFASGRERPITPWTIVTIVAVAMIPTIGNAVRYAKEQAAIAAVKPAISTAAIAGSDYARAYMLATYPTESMRYVGPLADAGHPEGLWVRGVMQVHEGDASTGRANIERAAKLGHADAIRWLREHPAPR